MDAKVTQFVKGSAVLVASNLIIKAINFFLLPLYTKYLTPAELGVSDSITNLVAILFPLLIMGLDSAFSAFYYDERTEKHVKTVFNTIMVTLLVAGLLPIVFGFVSPWVSRLLFTTDRYGMLVFVALISVSFNIWFTPYALLVRMQNRMALFGAINVVASLSMVLLNILFVSVLHLGAMSLILSAAMVHLLQCVLYLALAKMKIEPRYSDRQLLGKMLRYSLPLIPTVVAAWVLSISDRYILLHYFSETEVGIYGIAARFAGVLAIFSSGVFTAYTSFAFDKKDDDNAKVQYRRILEVFFLTVAIICVVATIWGREIITLMTSSAYHDAAPLLTGLLFGQLVYGVYTIVGYGISFVKKSNYFLLATAAGALVNIGLNFLFVPEHGALAASYTTYAGYLVMMLIAYFAAQHFYPCDYRMGKLLTVLALLSAVTIWVSLANPGLAVKAVCTILALGLLGVTYREAIADGLALARAVIRKLGRYHG